MIPKILPSRRTFDAVFRYNEKNASEFIGIENFPSSDKADLIRYFETFGAYAKVKDRVFHCSIALPPGEEVSDATFRAIAGDYMEMMGYGGQPYAMYRHYDRAHQHLHIVSSRVDFQTLKKVNDSFERLKSQKAADFIEKKYNLIQVERFREKKMVRLSEGTVYQINEAVSKAMQHKPVNMEELQELIGQELKIMKVSKGNIFFNIQNHGRGKGIASSQLPVFQDRSLKQQLLENKREKIRRIAESINEKVSAVMEKKPHSTAKLVKLLGEDIKLVETAKGYRFLSASSDDWVSSSQLPCFMEKSLKKQIIENFSDWKNAKQMAEDVLNRVIVKVGSIHEFQSELSREGVQAILHSNSGGVYGISFVVSGFEFKGSETGKNFTWTALSRHFDTLGRKRSQKSQKAVKLSGKIEMGDSGKVLPTAKLGHVSTVEDDWKRKERKKKKNEEERSEENTIFI